MKKELTQNLYLIGFYGAGSEQTFGNLWFEQLAMQLDDSLNVPAQLYAHNGSISAIRRLLQALDSDGSRIITERKLEGISIGVLGYSWGGVGAIGFTQRLSQAGEIVVGGTPRQPISYRLEVPIPISVLFTIDPVSFLNPPGTVRKNVAVFLNIIQQRGGKTVFVPKDGGPGEIQIGNWLSERLEGTFVESDAELSIQFDAAQVGLYRCGYPFAMAGDFREYCLSGKDCGHDGIPWLATPEVVEALKGNYRTLEDLQSAKIETLREAGGTVPQRVKFEVRKNPLVTDFTVSVPPFPAIPQSAFQRPKPGIFVFESNVPQLPNPLAVTLNIFGPGSTTQPPKAVCITSVNRAELAPMIKVSIPHGQNVNSGSETYRLPAPSTALTDSDPQTLGRGPHKPVARRVRKTATRNASKSRRPSNP